MKMNPILRDLITDDPADLWGAALSVHYAIADVLTAWGEHVPRHWEFRPSLVAEQKTLNRLVNSRNYEDSEIAIAVLAGKVTADDLRYAGNVLHRYTNVLHLAGKSY
jgi:hypothetical protein